MPNEFLQQMRTQKLSAIIFQKSGRNAFRDRITFFNDENILFERFCYGEAAGLVFTLSANKIDEENNILWDYDACNNSKKTDAPIKFKIEDSNNISFDDKPTLWECVEKKKAGILARIFRK